MTSVKDTAQAYEPKKVKTIADLEAVSVEQEIKSEVKLDSNDEKYEVSYVVVDGEKYRVPNSVLEQLQAIFKEKPDMKTFSVSKSGEGLQTKYQVIQLE